MLFLRLIIKNLFNRKTRTILTIVGISIGIATIIIFGMVSNGLTNSMSTAFKPGKADFTVAKADVADMILSVVTREQLQTVRNTEGVESVVPYVMSLAPFTGNPYFILGGIDPNDLDLLGARITDGRIYRNGDEVAIGRIAAKNYNLKVGDTIVLNNKDYAIVGIFESGVTMQDGGAATTIAETQRLNSYTDNQVSMAMVNINPGLDPRAVADAVEARDTALLCVVDMDDFGSLDQGLSIIDSVSWAISVLAMVIGGIGVMNTIIMSVFERTREIGVLRAVGWKRRRVMAMILGEAIVISLGAAIIGIALGLGVVWLMMQTNMAKSWLDITMEAEIFLQALLVAVVVVILGALYPAYRASRFSPMEALRYE
ncbi:MAG: ABC transporter permease [Patescibacteria group bacterium]|nr:ABC transporter permease [Patescibacteria group bacterium]MDD5715761.1 ABC transporter permease [Patescibacteria group bacterium]